MLFPFRNVCSAFLYIQQRCEKVVKNSCTFMGYFLVSVFCIIVQEF